MDEIEKNPIKHLSEDIVRSKKNNQGNTSDGNLSGEEMSGEEHYHRKMRIFMDLEKETASSDGAYSSESRSPIRPPLSNREVQRGFDVSPEEVDRYNAYVYDSSYMEEIARADQLKAEALYNNLRSEALHGQDNEYQFEDEYAGLVEFGDFIRKVQRKKKKEKDERKRYETWILDADMMHRRLKKGENNCFAQKPDDEDYEPSKKRQKLEREEVKEGEIDVDIIEKVEDKEAIEELDEEEDKDTVEGPEECIICLIEMKKGEEVACLPCMHVYHKACIDYWFKHRKECPIDRARHL